MSEPVKKKVKVLGAQYNHEARSIVLQVEFENGKFFTQIPISSLLPNITNLDQFSEEQMKDATLIFCKNIIGKIINVVFDKDLNDKLRDNYPLNYWGVTC